MKPNPTRAIIRGMHIFAGLSDEALDSLAAACRRFTAPRGRIIVREGMPGRAMFLIGKGRVVVVKNAGSRNEIPLAALGPGDVFGEMSLIECRNRSASVRCVGPCVYYSLKSADLLKLFRGSPQQYSILILNISRALSRRLRKMDEVFAATAY